MKRIPLAGLAVGLLMLLTACTTKPPNNPPAIASFSASPSSGTTPLTTTFGWNVSDPDGDPLTCRLDVDNNGTFEYTLSNCTSGASQQHTYNAAGNYTAKLVVSDSAGLESSKTATVTVNAPAPGSADPFDITLRFTGSPTPGQQAAFEAAAAKWEQVITQGFPSTSLSIPANDCADGLPAFNGSVDDILIDAAVVAIDGRGGTLGQAGPCLIGSSNHLTLYGIMQFDSADLADLEASGLLDEVIFHEMGHVLGIGALWDSLLTGAGTSDPRFVGANAVREWQALGGSGSVPVENTGGPGTRDGHWRESVFGNEIMTGYLDAGINPLSRVTIGSLADLGYTVNYNAADPYSLPPRLLRASSTAKIPLNTILLKPKGTVQ